MNNDIGGKIASLRKSKSMTQEALANLLGISPQAVSKWETGITLPDIVLLPIIADALDTDINALFGIEPKDCTKYLAKQNVHEEMYNEFFNLLQGLWNCYDKEGGKEAVDYIRENRNAQTLVLSNLEGNGVYADADIAFTFNKAKSDIPNLFDSDIPWTVLKRFADGETRTVLKFILSNDTRAFTSSLVAQKCNIDIKSAENALENLLKLKLVKRTDINTGDEIIHVFSAWGQHKKLLIYAMLTIAARLGEYSEIYRGFMG